MGTIINFFAIIIGSLIGLIARRGLPERLQKSLTDALGLGIFVIGIIGIVRYMLIVGEDHALSDSGSLLLIVSLTLGVIIGELLRIEDRINNLGKMVERKLGKSGISVGFVNASIVFCVGAMAIVGSINDGLLGDSSILIIKSALDGIGSIVFTATMGFGVALSAVSVFLYQGAITLSAGLIQPYCTDEMITVVSMVGYALIICLGTNFLGYTKIKTANFLPALLIPIVYTLIRMAIGA